MLKIKRNSVAENIVGLILLIVGIRLSMPSWYVMLHGDLNLLWFIGAMVCFMSSFCIFIDVDQFTDFICGNSLDDDDDEW